MKAKENKIYNAIIDYCNNLELLLPTLDGNLVALEMTKLVSEALLSEQQKIVYNTLKLTPQSAKEISIATGYSSKDVSAVLNQLDKNYSLIKWELWKSPKSNIVTKRKLYFKIN